MKAKKLNQMAKTENRWEGKSTPKATTSWTMLT